MFEAKVISYTQPTEEFKDKVDGILDLIAFCARVSNPSNQYNSETAEKLIRYLIKHKHWSPLEMVDITIEVKVTRDIGRQLLRHGFRFQEFSQRYSSEFTFMTKDARLQDTKNRQNSIEFDNPEIKAEWTRRQEETIRRAKEDYEWATGQGIAKEVARVVLPEGLTMSTMYTKGSIRSWLHYLETRTEPSTQLEHRELANMIAKEIAKYFVMIEEYVK